MLGFVLVILITFTPYCYQQTHIPLTVDWAYNVRTRHPARGPSHGVLVTYAGWR